MRQLTFERPRVQGLRERGFQVWPASSVRQHYGRGWIHQLSVEEELAFVLVAPDTVQLYLKAWRFTPPGRGMRVVPAAR